MSADATFVCDCPFGRVDNTYKHSNVSMDCVCVVFVFVCV